MQIQLQPEDRATNSTSDRCAPNNPLATNEESNNLDPSHLEILEKLRHPHETRARGGSLLPPMQPGHHNDRLLGTSSMQASHADGIAKRKQHELLIAERFQEERRRFVSEACSSRSLKPHIMATEDMLKRHEALFSLHTGRPKYDYISRFTFSMPEQAFAAAGTSVSGGGSKSGLVSPAALEDEDELDPSIVEQIEHHAPPVPTTGGQWTYEEQFKQLYELSGEPERKKFLDELFAFMQKKGSPVNRIPIMAKQTLDLYQLFKLVVAKGGLVEVINKKLWREITKGLNLPSSITSAAFTLRTQYMKYLYPYECEKNSYSTPQELQAAIDGNRREGRRQGYGFDLSPSGSPPSFYPGSHLNGNIFGNASPTMALNPFLSGHMLQKAAAGTPFPGGYRDNPALEEEGRGLAVSAGCSPEGKENTEPTAADSKRQRLSAPTSPPQQTPSQPQQQQQGGRECRDERETSKERDFRPPHPPQHSPDIVPTAHFKITSRSDGRSEFDNSLVVSMDINGVTYQGVLFAQPRKTQL